MELLNDLKEIALILRRNREAKKLMNWKEEYKEEDFSIFFNKEAFAFGNLKYYLEFDGDINLMVHKLFTDFYLKVISVDKERETCLAMLSLECNITKKNYLVNLDNLNYYIDEDGLPLVDSENIYLRDEIEELCNEIAMDYIRKNFNADLLETGDVLDYSPFKYEVYKVIADELSADISDVASNQLAKMMEGTPKTVESIAEILCEVVSHMSKEDREEFLQSLKAQCV